MASMALAFDILARDKGASRTFDRVGDSAKRAGDRGTLFGSMFKKGLAVATGALAAAGLAKGIGELAQFLGDSIGEAREAQKVGKTTAQIIKATGGTAKVSAKQVEDLATALSEKTGIDDEAIQSGSNLLLTFKRVRNEAGKGSDIFDRATAAAADLSKAGFGSIEGASKMLGKALNDPLKGVTALSRAGVTFTDQQKKQIDTLVKSGDVLGAQKIILGEVESQVGGVAEKSASMSDKVKVAWDNFKERIGTALLPALDKLGDWFLKKGLPALQRFFGWVEKTGIPALSRFGDWFKTDVLPKVKAFGDWFTNRLWPALKHGYDVVMPALRDALDDIAGGADGAGLDWKKLGDIIVDKVIPFIVKMTTVYLPAWAKQIGLVIAAIKAIGTFFSIQVTIAKRATSIIIAGFVKVATFAAKLFDALSHVPGFGWAKTAADKMRGAAEKGERLADAINGIKSKSVTVSVAYKSTYSGRFDKAPTGYGPGRAGGGTVQRTRIHPVGENPDGSWNRTTELFVPNENGRIVTQRQAAAAAAAAMAGGTTTTASAPPMNRYVMPLLIDGRKVAEAVFDVAGEIISGGLATAGADL